MTAFFSALRTGGKYSYVWNVIGLPSRGNIIIEINYGIPVKTLILTGV